jgi:head-tail adaptor
MAYDVPFIWKKFTSSTVDAHNKKVQDWVGTDVLWGSLEGLSSSESEKYGGERTRITATVRIHQFPTLGVRDRLLDSRYNELYIIESFHRDHDNNELVVSVYYETGRLN